MAGADTFYLSQAEEDFPLVNEDYSLNGQNMIIAYNSPVKDITVIGKPFNWHFFPRKRSRTFLLLGDEISRHGLAWIRSTDDINEEKKSSIANRCICADIFSSSPVVVHATCGRFDFLYFGTDDCFLSLFLQS